MADKVTKDVAKPAPVAADKVAASVVAKAKTAPAAKAPAAKVSAPAPKNVAPVAEKPAPAPAAEPVIAQAMPVKTPEAVKTETTPIAATASPAPQPKKEVTMENTVKNTAEKAQTMFVEMNDRAKAAMEKTQGLFADMNEFNKGNVEALVESSKIAAKGIETLGQDAAEYTRKSFEGMTAIVKSLAAVKSPTEFMKLQSDYVRTSFDSMVAESSKTTETMLKLAGEIAQPISNRVAVAAEKIKISA